MDLYAVQDARCWPFHHQQQQKKKSSDIPTDVPATHSMSREPAITEACRRGRRLAAILDFCWPSQLASRHQTAHTWLLTHPHAHNNKSSKANDSTIPTCGIYIHLFSFDKVHTWLSSELRLVHDGVHRGKHNLKCPHQVQASSFRGDTQMTYIKALIQGQPDTTCNLHERNRQMVTMLC